MSESALKDLFEACEDGNSQAVVSLLNNMSINDISTAVLENDVSPLHLASANGHVRCISHQHSSFSLCTPHSTLLLPFFSGPSSSGESCESFADTWL